MKCGAWRVQCEVCSVKEAVGSEKCEVWSVKFKFRVRRAQCEVWSVKCEVWSVKQAVRSEKCEVWSVKCEVWFFQIFSILALVFLLHVSLEQLDVWGVKCGVWSLSVECEERSVKCEVWGLECEGSSEKCEVWTVKCEVWVKCGVWSAKWEVWSLDCEVWSGKEAVRSEKCEVWTVKCGVWSAKWEVWSLECEGSSEKCEVRSVKCGLWSVECEVRSEKCEVWSLECEGSSEKWEVWNVECEVWSVKCEVRSVDCEVWSVKCGLWSVKCEVWTVKCEVCSVKCEVWGLECEGSSEKWEVWSVKCGVWSLKFGVRRVQCAVWGVECRGKDTIGTGCLWTIGHLCLGNFRRRLARVYVTLRVALTSPQVTTWNQPEYNMRLKFCKNLGVEALANVQIVLTCLFKDWHLSTINPNFAGASLSCASWWWQGQLLICSQGIFEIPVEIWSVFILTNCWALQKQGFLCCGTEAAECSDHRFKVLAWNTERDLREGMSKLLDPSWTKTYRRMFLWRAHSSVSVVLNFRFERIPGQSPLWSRTSAWSEFQSLVAQPWSAKSHQDRFRAETLFLGCWFYSMYMFWQEVLLKITWGGGLSCWNNFCILCMVEIPSWTYSKFFESCCCLYFTSRFDFAPGHDLESARVQNEAQILQELWE